MLAWYIACSIGKCQVAHHTAAAAAAAAAKQNVYYPLSPHVFLIKIVNHKDQGKINWYPYVDEEKRDEVEKTKKKSKNK